MFLEYLTIYSQKKAKLDASQESSPESGNKWQDDRPVEARVLELLLFHKRTFAIVFKYLQSLKGPLSPSPSICKPFRLGTG